MKNKEELSIGDYITLDKLKEKVIYKVLNIEELQELTLKVVFPKDLAKALKEHNIFSLKVPFKDIAILGDPIKNKNLRTLYE